MRDELLTILRAPDTGETLTLYPFESGPRGKKGERIVIEGVLVAERAKKAYPILGGVPVMLEGAFPKGFIEKHRARLEEILAKNAVEITDSGLGEWSFSAEWQHHFDSDLNITWGWSTQERVEQFFYETGVRPETCDGKVILDAGCGNGQLSDALGDYCGMVAHWIFRLVSMRPRKRGSEVTSFSCAEI